MQYRRVLIHDDSKSAVIVAVGGTLAGLAVVAIFFFALMYCRKKRRLQLVTEIEPNHMPFNAFNPGLPSPHIPQPAMSYTPTSYIFNTTTPPDPQLPSNTTSAQNSYNSQPALPSSGTFLIPPTHGTDGRSNTTFSAAAGNRPTNEQMDFAHTLYNHNIPAPAIAHMMEKMVGGNEVCIPDGHPSTGSGVSRRDTTATKAPPVYTPYYNT